MVGLPVVPEEAWMRMISLCGAACRPKDGYAVSAIGNYQLGQEIIDKTMQV